VLVRENSEGLYPGREGDLADLVRLMPDLADRTGRTVKAFGTEGRFAVKVVTPRGAERIARFSCDLARRRQGRGKPGKVTLVTKSNVLPRTDGLYDEIVGRIVREAALAFEHFHVDDAARRLVRFPKSMDVVLCMNLYGDILSDLGAETAGGLAALMLEHMGLGEEGRRLETAVGRVYRDGKTLTPDQGGTAKTREVAQAVLAAYN
jgi:isocitrate/isopropylmalate dehydrogenase